MRISTRSNYVIFLTITLFFSLLSYKELYASTPNSSDGYIYTTITSVTLYYQHVDQFKEYLKKDTILESNNSACIEMIIDSILNEISNLKQRDIPNEAIGIAFDEVAEIFRDHDYFSVDRFDGTLTIAEQQIENARLMKNWQKWYTYKALARYFTKKDFSIEDAAIMAKSATLDDLNAYISDKEDYEEIFLPAEPFYTEKSNFSLTMHAKLTEKIDGFSTFMDSLNATEDQGETGDETDTI
jgi:hypothetical protein